MVLNIAAVAAMAWTTATSARTPAVFALAGGVTCYVWRTGDLMVSPWNPHVVVLPMLTFIVLAARFAATGRHSLLPWLVLLGSFLVQTHVAMALPVVLLLFVAAAVRRDAIRARWHAVLSLALMAWLPSIIEQLTHHPGNMTRIVSFFATASAGQPLSVAAAAWSAALTSAFSRDFAVAMGFDVRPVGVASPLAWSAAQLGLLAAAAVRARARGDRFSMWLAVMSGLTSAIALVAVTRIRERIVDHEVFWLSAVGVLNAVVIVGALDWPARRSRVAQPWAQTPRTTNGLSLRPLPPVRSSVPAAAAAAAAVIAAATIGLAGMRHVLGRPRTIDDHSVDVLAARIDRYISDGHVRRPLIHIEQDIWPIAAGALLILHKNGVGFAVDKRWTAMFGETFEANGREDAQVTITGSAHQPRIVTMP